MNKKILASFMGVVAFLLTLLIAPFNAEAWSLKNVELSNVVIDDNNKITEYTVHFYIDTYLASAKGYIGVQKVPFTESDFTDYGNVAKKRFRSLYADDGVTKDEPFMKEYGIVGFSSDDGEGFPVFGNNRQIDREFIDLDIQLYENDTYYVYLWTHYNNLVYPDALIGTIEFDGTGTISVNDSAGSEEKIYYTLKYETNGGSAIASKSILNGTSAIKPTSPTRDGFTFNGWYADENFEVPFDFDMEIADNLVVYAKWSKSLSFIGYDGMYDGKAHSIIIDGDIDGYEVLYSLDGNDFHLSEAPEYTDVGNYTIYYKATKEGYEDLTGSVNINIREKKQEESIIETNPETGDNFALWCVMATLSYLGIMFISINEYYSIHHRKI